VTALVSSNDIMHAIRAEPAPLTGEAREQRIKARYFSTSALFRTDLATVEASAVSDAELRAKAETDWNATSEEWEQILPDLQADLARTRSGKLASAHLVSLTRLYGATGFRAGIDVAIGLLELLQPAEVVSEEWEPFSAIDSGRGSDPLPRVLGRSPLFGGEPLLGSLTSISRSIRMMQGDQSGVELPTRASLEQELSALGDTPNAIQQLEALYREGAERIMVFRALAEARQVPDHQLVLEASRRLLHEAAGVIRQLAPDQFQVTAEPSAATPGAQSGPGRQGGSPNLAGAEDGFVFVRERKLKELEALGAWFRKFEPHNPAGYVIPELVRRATLDLPRLLTDLFGASEVDSLAAKRLFTILGIAEPASPSQGASSGGSS
jgi:hypothetical protein